MVALPAPPALIAAAGAPQRDGLANVSMTSGPVSSEQVRDLELRLLAMEQRLRDASRGGDARVINASATTSELARSIEELRSWRTQQNDMNFAVQDSFGKLLTRTNRRSRRTLTEVSAMARPEPGSRRASSRFTT